MKREILNLIHNSEKIIVVGHVRPDGDAAGSVLALYHRFKDKKDIIPMLPDEIAWRLRFMPDWEKITIPTQPVESDLLIMVDCNEKKRLAHIGDLIIPYAKKIIIIDHHIKSRDVSFSDIAWIEPQRAATGCLIYELLKEDGEINKDEAICLYGAIATDTGFFQYSNVDSDVFEVCSDLVKIGVNPAYVSEYFNMNFPVERMEILGEFLNNTKWEMPVAYGFITQDMLKKYGVDMDMTEGFARYLLMVNDIKVAVFIKEYEDVIRVSFRSKYGYRVNHLAYELGGGGHKNAAGCDITGSIEDVYNRIKSLIEEKGIIDEDN